MKIKINKASDLPVHMQLREQIIFEISTTELPVGYLMPSVRELARRLRIHHNTVSLVYSELVAERWLVKNASNRLVVVDRGDPVAISPDNDLDAQIDRLLALAQSEGLTTESLLARIQKRAEFEPPDHLLIVEPEAAMGKVMRYEVLKVTGKSAVSYPVERLKREPTLLDRAKLLVPVHLFDLMGFVPERQRVDSVVLRVSPFDAHKEQVRLLRDPSVIGMLTVSASGLRTMAGEIADCIGTRHRLLHFWMQPPSQGDRNVTIRRWTKKFEPPKKGVRNRAYDGTEPAQDVSTSDLPLATAEDLQAVDLLLCDSIAYDLVRHPNRLKYQMISPESLQKIAALGLATS